MLQAINTKLLLAILAALAGISSLLYTMHEDAQKRDSAVAVRQAQADKAQADFQAWRVKAEEVRKRRSVAPGNESQTWQKYVP